MYLPRHLKGTNEVLFRIVRRLLLNVLLAL
jgi:hypothetical protein